MRYSIDTPYYPYPYALSKDSNKWLASNDSEKDLSPAALVNDYYDTAH